MKIKFLLPGTTRTYHCGGLFIALKLTKFLAELQPVEIVTYKDREPDHAFLTEDDLATPDDSILWVVTWGPDVTALLRRLAGHRVAYYAQSAGWSIDMPAGVTILCISKFVMGYWTRWAPANPVFLLPPTLDPECRNHGKRRDIDVLYLNRKTTPYLDRELIPRLRERCRVETIEELLPHKDVLDLFNRSKVYVYDFSPTASRAWVDGFGLQPLEAIVCGCTVFTTISGGPIDYLDPGVNCGQIGLSAEHDRESILAALGTHGGSNPHEGALRSQFSEEALRERLRVIVPQLEKLDVRAASSPQGIPMTGESREIVGRQQQELAVLKDLVAYHENAVQVHRDGVEWLRAEVRQRDETIASREEGIAWLRSEVEQRDRTLAPAIREKSVPYRMYRRALSIYQRPNGGAVHRIYRSLLEGSVRAAAVAMSRTKGVQFPSRAIGGWWSIWRWRFEFLAGWNEHESVAACRRLIRPGMTVLDVGAHLGYYTRLFSDLVGPNGRVLAFEPEPENFSLLQKNLRHAGNVEIFPCAVSDHAGSAVLHLSPGHSNHSLVEGYTEQTGTAAVETVALDSFLADRALNAIGFVKIDVEGGEPRVLAGMRETISRSPEIAMLVEYNPTALRCGGTAPEELTRFLAETGFAVQAALSDGTWGAIPDLRDGEVVNLLCLRPAAGAARPFWKCEIGLDHYARARR